MKNNFLLGLIALFSILFVVSCDSVKKDGETEWQEAVLDSKLDSTSYALGMDLAERSFVPQSIDIDYYAFLQGVMDVMDEDKEPIFNAEEKQRIFMVFQQELRNKQQEVAMKQAEENKEKGRAFLEENKTKEGVMVTESGLQYKVINEGTGKSPAATDQVKVHYKGTLIDGTQFDSSYDRGEPVTFVLNRVIRGWTEGLQLMKEGSKYMLFIPSDLAYGDQGAGGQIQGGSTLIFEVELLEVLPPDASAQ